MPKPKVFAPLPPPTHTKHPSSHPLCPKHSQQIGAAGGHRASLCRVMRPPSSGVPFCFSQPAAVEAAVLQAPLTAPGLSPASSSQGHAEDQLAQPMLPKLEQGTSQVKFSSRVYNIYARGGISDKYPVTQLCRVRSSPTGAAAVSCQSLQSPREMTP